MLLLRQSFGNANTQSEEQFMSRFGDLWKSGKMIMKDQKEESQKRFEEVRKLAQELNPEVATGSPSDQILSALKSRRGQETGRWLREMAKEDVLKPVATQTQTRDPGTFGFEATISWIDALFEQFTELAFEFNKTAVGTELMLSCENPKLHEKKSDDTWYRPVVKTYQGRLTTRQWALLVKGKDAKIIITIVPASMLLAFTTEEFSENDFPPLMEVVREDVDGKQTWTIGGEAAPMEAISHLAKELLGDLIRVSSGVMSESELFGRTGSAPKLGENLAVGYQRSSAGETTTEAVAKKHAPNFDEMNVFDACDVVDSIIERELKKLYEETSKIRPGSAMAETARMQISAMETFRSKVVAAFEEFTRAAHGLSSQAPAEEQSAPELLGPDDSYN